MSNQSRLDESNINNKNKEIRLILQIVKTVTIDKFSTILDIKKLSRQHFSKYADDFNLQIKEYDITSLDNMNAFRTLDYYKSNIISVNAKSLKKFLNESNIVSKMNSEIDNSQTLFDSKEKISENYLANRNNLKKVNNEDYLKINQYSNQEEIITNRSQFEPKVNNRDVDLPDNFSNFNIGVNRFNNPIFSPIRATSNLNTYQSYMNENDPKTNPKRNFNKSQIYSSSDSLFSQEIPRANEINDVKPKNSLYHIPISERLKNYAINNNTPLNTYKERSFINDHLLSTQEKDYQNVKEEIENLSITNKILNKSNLELKHYIKSIEDDKENEKDLRYKLIESTKVIEGLKNNIMTLQKTNQELTERFENLKKNTNEILSENKKSVSEIENLNKNFEILDKSNFELKNQIDSLEEMNKRQETEKFNLVSQLNEKEKIISELQEKIRCLNELNSTTKKSCRDYEDMLKGMKRTIDIMKKSNDDSDAEIMRLKLNLDEVKENLSRRNDEYECLEKVKASLQNEVEMLKNEVLFLASENNNKEKNINDSSSNLRNIYGENERLKMKLENLGRIIEEKDKTIENMKISVLSLNRNLEESKTEIENLKRKLNEELIEKNKLSRNSDIHDYHFTEYKKQIEELTRLKDNLYKQNFALEEDNVEHRNRYYQIRNENENLNMKINFLNESIKDLQTEILKISNNKNTTDLEKDSLNLKINELHSLLNNAKSNEFSLRNDIDNLNSKIGSKERTIDNLLKSKDELNNEIFNLKEKLSNMFNDKIKLTEDYDNKNNEIQLNDIKIKREIEKLNNDLRSKDNLIENLQKTIQEFNIRLNEFSNQREKERVILEKNIEELKKKLMESVEKEKIQKIEKEDCSNDLKYKIKFIESLETRINELNDNIYNLKKSNEKLSNEKQEFFEKNEEYKQINDDLYNRLDKTNQKNDTLSIHLEELKNQQQEILNKNSALQKEFLYYKNINEKLESKISYLENNNISNIYKNKLDLNSNNSNNNSNNNIYKRIYFINVGTDKSKMNEPGKEDGTSSPMRSPKKKDSYNMVRDFYVKPDESDLQTSEINAKFEKKRKDKIDIFDGAKVIFNIFDKKRILRFDIESRLFKVIDFADFGGFEQNYTAKNSFSVNIMDGLLIVTGENSDLFYHYSHNKHSMNKLSNLNFSHERGCLVYDEFGNTIFCLSGKNSKAVERYVNDEIINTYNKKGKSTNIFSNESQLKNSWQKYPELNSERILGSFIVVEKSIYAFFGLNTQSTKYLDTIERLNLESPLSWEIINFKKNDNISCYKKNFATAKLSSDEILMIGGIDGFNENPSENFSIFNLKKNEFFYLDNKVNVIDSNLSYDFHRNPCSIPSYDLSNNCFLVSIDEKDSVHIIESKTLQHIIFNSLE